MIIKKIYAIILKIITFLVNIDFAKTFDAKIRFNKKINLREPQSLSDKICYIELHKSSSLPSFCTDKYSVREYVTKKGLEEILIPCIGGPWDKFIDIEFSKLPKEYVLKATHGCKMNYIVNENNPLDIKKCEKNVKRWLKTTYGTYSVEPHYKKIPHRIYAETYLKNNDDIIDYKFHCINGVPKFVLVCSKRFVLKNNKMAVTLDTFDMEWNRLDVMIPYGSEIIGNGDVKKPIHFNEMIQISKRLSQDFDFVRVDLYELNNKVYFGELTFTPGCGVLPYYKDDFLMEMGRKMIITKETN